MIMVEINATIKDLMDTELSLSYLHLIYQFGCFINEENGL